MANLVSLELSLGSSPPKALAMLSSLVLSTNMASQMCRLSANDPVEQLALLLRFEHLVVHVEVDGAPEG